MSDTIEFLRRYNEWRQGDDAVERPDSEEVDRQLEVAITKIENGEKYSSMLSQICGIVSEFAESDEDTTLMCVARLRAKYYDAMSLDAYDFVQKLEKERYNQDE